MNPRNMFGGGLLRRVTGAPRGPDTSPDMSPATPQDASGCPDAQRERALVARARLGDQEAFATLVREHQRQVYTLALRMLHSEEEASEATQEVFLSAWQHLGSFRGEARLATWLYRITYHHCLKVMEGHRREEAARVALAEASAREHSPEGRISAQLASAAEREVSALVRAAIANLPEKYRSVLVLRHLQELSYEEMADVMRVPIGTVKTQLFRARAQLRERLEGLDRARVEGAARAGELKAGLEAGLRSVLEQRGISWARGTSHDVHAES